MSIHRVSIKHINTSNHNTTAPDSSLATHDGDFIVTKGGSYIIVNKPIVLVPTVLGYGRLYNWYAVNDSRGIAPTGWHIPTQTELETMSTYLGGDSVSGGKLKEDGLIHWNIPNTGADNSSGFKLFGGGVYDGTFFDLKVSAYLWSKTSIDSNNAETFAVDFQSIATAVGNSLKITGQSVRCIKDDNIAPTSSIVIDHDGNVYTWVHIGTQYWLVQNLATQHYNNGDAIGTDFTGTDGAVCAYNNDNANV